MPPADVGIRWEEKTAAAVFSDLVRKQQQIRNFTAAFSITMTPPPKGRPAHLQGVMVFEKTATGPVVRIQGMGPFGRTAFDMVRRENRVEIYIPGKKTLYHGPVPTRPDAWGSLFSGMFTDLSETAVRENSRLKVESDAVRLDLTDGFLLLDKQTGLLKRYHRKDGILTYDSYLRQTDAPSIPGHIRLEKTDGSLRAECRLDQIRINTDPGNAFDLTHYAPVFIRDINELDP